MLFKKITAAVLTTVLILTTATGAMGDSTPIKSETPTVPYYGSFSGTIQEITTRGNTSDQTLVFTKNEQGAEAHLVISKETYVAGTLKTGAKVTGYYNQNAPMILIYPPQYSVETVTVEAEGLNYKVDTFDSQMVSADNSLKLNIGASTAITNQEGTPFTGSLAGRKLLVQYGVSTRSIPAQTTPDRIIVLYDREYASAPQMTGPELEAAAGSVEAMKIVVENKVLSAPKAYVTPAGIIMVPLRSVAEGLGLTVGWKAETQTITLGKAIGLTLGSGNYYNYQKALLWQGTPSELKESSTYVPLQFFKAVAGASNAYVFEGQIVVNTQVPMN